MTATRTFATFAVASLFAGCIVVAREPPRSEVSTPPPAEPAEAPIACPIGYARVAGQWRWNGYQYLRVPQRCEYRPGFRWEPGTWKACGDGYCYQEGSWIQISGDVRVGP